jgi:hypothetical protein
MKTLAILAALSGDVSYDTAVNFLALIGTAERACEVEFSDQVWAGAIEIVLAVRPKDAAMRDVEQAIGVTIDKMIDMGRVRFCEFARVKAAESYGVE